MAYNPFNWFRKHQKVIFAGLTILCMFVFILQFGRGDFFEQMLGYIRERHGTGASVAKLNGKTITEGDLDEVRRRRLMASEFLKGVVFQGQAAALAELSKGALKMESRDEPGKGDPLALILVGIQVRGQQPWSEPESIRAVGTIMQEAAKAKGDPDRLRLVERVGSMVGFQIWRSQQHGNNQLYMGGGTTVDELLDFLIWKQQADKMALSLTDADVMRAINAEAAGHPTFDPAKKSFDSEERVEAFLKSQNDKRLKPSDLLDALRDEFRMSMAREFETGEPSGTRFWRVLEGAATPATGTPEEFLDFYREKTTAIKVRLLRVPVKAFVADVKASPSESDLRALFAQHRDAEPAPALRAPGFKLPRRIKAAYAVASADDPYFLAKGREAVWGKAKPGARRPGGIAGNYLDWRHGRDSLLIPALPVIGAGPGGVLPIACTIGFDPVQIGYSRLLSKQHLWGMEEAPDPLDPELRLSNEAVFKPRTLAALVGQLSGDPRAAMVGLWARTTHGDAKTDLRKHLALLMGSASGSTDAALGNLALSILTHPRPVSPSLARWQVLADIEKRFTQEAFQETLRLFQDKVRQAADRKSPETALAKAAADLHLTLHSMPHAVTKAVLLDELERKNDLGLAALRKVGGKPMTRAEQARQDNFFRKTQRWMARVEDTPESVANALFAATGTYSPTRAILDRSYDVPNLETPTDRSEDERIDKQAVYWRTEDLPATIRTFEQARADVEAAWRLDRARQLARRTALAIEEKINEKKGTAADARALLAEEKARDPRLGAVFEMDNVALMTPILQNLPILHSMTQYRSYEMPASVRAEMPYPPADLSRLVQERKQVGDPEDLVKELLDLKRLGEAKVIVDMPARDFYVAVLEERSPQTFDEFSQVYSNTPERDRLHLMFELRKRKELYAAVLKQLRREAAGGRLDKDGFIEVSAEARKRYAAASQSGE